MTNILDCGHDKFGYGAQPYRSGRCYQRNLTDDPRAFTCVECGGLSNSDGWAGGDARREKSLCSHCDFWLDWVKRFGPGDVVIDGRKYHYDPRCPIKGGESSFRGFGGRTFKIRLHGGAEVTTNNLWTQGEIPAHFLDRFPNNAEFIT